VRSDEADVVGEAGSGVAGHGGKRDDDVVHDEENCEAEDGAEENRLAQNRREHASDRVVDGSRSGGDEELKEDGGDYTKLEELD